MKWVVALIALLVAYDLGMAYINRPTATPACCCTAGSCPNP